MATTATVLLEDDLMFGSRVRAALAGLPVRSVYRLDQLLAAVGESGATTVILNLSGGPAPKLAAVQALRAAGPVRIIGILGHKERAERAAAKLAGCQVILPHSAVSTRLRNLLAAWDPQAR
jgi:DNA-binding NarL/FixJ family response regulator